jgi:hypothetical protein
MLELTCSQSMSAYNRLAAVPDGHRATAKTNPLGHPSKDGPTYAYALDAVHMACVQHLTTRDTTAISQAMTLRLNQPTSNPANWQQARQRHGPLEFMQRQPLILPTAWQTAVQSGIQKGKHPASRPAHQECTCAYASGCTYQCLRQPQKLIHRKPETAANGCW